MKRVFVFMLTVVMAFTLTACGTNNKPADQSKTVTEIKWARANSGNILVTIAKQKGYFEEAGLKVTEVPIDSSTDALTALQTGRVDVTSNQGTNGPLQFIGTGSDFTVVGGYMLKGMYLVSKANAVYNGPKDLAGKKIAYNGIHTVTAMGMLDAGMDPMKDAQWLSYPTNSDRLSAVIAGEADYAVLSGDQLYNVGKNKDLKIAVWLNDLVPNYGCCRMNMNTKFVKENPETVKKLLMCLIRAEQYYLAHKEECVAILAKDINAKEDYVKAYLLNPNYVSSVDPCKNAVVKTWNAMVAIGQIKGENAKKIDINAHINTELYKEALDECVAKYGNEDPKFYQDRIAFFNANDK